MLAIVSGSSGTGAREDIHKTLRTLYILLEVQSIAGSIVKPICAKWFYKGGVAVLDVLSNKLGLPRFRPSSHTVDLYDEYLLGNRTFTQLVEAEQQPASRSVVDLLISQN